MKPGIITAAFIVVVFVIVVAVVFITPPPDPPTEATSPQRLRQITLPEDLPAVFPATAPDADAQPHLDAAIAMFRANRLAFEGGYLDRPLIEQAAAHLIEAARCGKVSAGFIDQDTPIRVGGGRIDSPLMPVAAKVLQLASEQAAEGQTDPAKLGAAAVFSLGRRAFEHNQLLGSKQFGLMLMSDAGQQLFALTGDDPAMAERLIAAANAVNAVHDAWTQKLQIVMSTDPHVGDLLNIAQLDQDRAFRIAATAQLGVAKFTNGQAGNRKAIAAYLEQAKQSDDPLIVRAAEAADALTKDGLHRLR